MSGTIVVDRIESDASYASSINIASPIQISNTITGNVNFDSGTLFVDSVNNRVGIGTQNPVVGLQVTNPSGGGQIRVVSSGGNILQLISDSSEASIRAVAAVPLTFRTSNEERMNIDASGRVTKPYQPYCLVGRNDGNVNAQTAPIPWNQVVYNIGSHFNTSTYRFTAPVAGYYYASINAMAIGTNPIEVALRINGGTAVNTRNGGGASNYNSTSATYVLYLAVNDYIDAKVEGAYNMSGGDGYAYSGMCVYLLG